MIFDGLPIMSAGGGTKIVGPHVYDISVKKASATPGPWTLRLEGEGVVTFWGKKSTSGSSDTYYNLIPLPSPDGNNYTFTLEIDGETYSFYDASTMQHGVGEMVGGYGAIDKRSAPQPINYIFHEYLEVVISGSGSPVPTTHYAFEYYDLDADNPVTVTFA